MMCKEILASRLDSFINRFEDNSGEVHREWILELIDETKEPEFLVTITVILSSGSLDPDEVLEELGELKD